MERFLIYDPACETCSALAETMRQAGGPPLATVPVAEASAQGLLTAAYPNGWEHAPYLVTADAFTDNDHTLCILPLNARFARLVVNVPDCCRVPPHTPAPPGSPAKPARQVLAGRLTATGTRLRRVG